MVLKGLVVNTVFRLTVKMNRLWAGIITRKLINIAVRLMVLKGLVVKYGVQTDRKDESAVGWDHHEKVDKHPAVRLMVLKGLVVNMVFRLTVKMNRLWAGIITRKLINIAVRLMVLKGLVVNTVFRLIVKMNRLWGWDHHEKVDKHASQKGNRIFRIHYNAVL